MMSGNTYQADTQSFADEEHTAPRGRPRLGTRVQVVTDSPSTCPVLHPEHWFQAKWDVAQVFALLYFAILVPVRIGFSIDLEPGSVEWTVELLFDIYFVVDIFINCAPVPTPAAAAC